MSSKIHEDSSTLDLLIISHELCASYPLRSGCVEKVSIEDPLTLNSNQFDHDDYIDDDYCRIRKKAYCRLYLIGKRGHHSE